MTDSVGIVVPAYDPDVEALSAYVHALRQQLDPETIRIELDAPEPGVEEALRDLPAVVHATPKRRGKGAAITYGFERLDTDLLVFADADGSTPAPSIAAVVEPLLDDRADLSVGSRRHPDADVRSHQTFARRHLGDAFALLAGRALDVDLYDFQCGAKALTRKCWTGVREHLYQPGFAWDVELIAMAAALDYRLAEVPVTWQDHPGTTVDTVETILALFRTVLSARGRARRIRGEGLFSRAPALASGRPLVERQPASGSDE